MHPILTIAIKAARDAANIINRYSHDIDRLDVQEKSPTQLVSEVDTMANNAILDEIKKNFPEHHIISEESKHANKSDSEYTWIIDPLDGTKNFLHGIPYYCVSVAIQLNGETEYAVIVDPNTQDIFTAIRGSGARMNDTRIRVSKTRRIDQAMLSTGMPFRTPAEIKPWLRGYAAVLPRASSILRSGASALDLAYVAAGRYDGLWQMGLQKWDMAAGVLLVQEAGGMISDLQGKQNHLEKGEVVCGNQHIHEKLQQLVEIHSA